MKISTNMYFIAGLTVLSLLKTKELQAGLELTATSYFNEKTRKYTPFASVMSSDRNNDVGYDSADPHYISLRVSEAFFKINQETGVVMPNPTSKPNFSLPEQREWKLHQIKQIGYFVQGDLRINLYPSTRPIRKTFLGVLKQLHACAVQEEVKRHKTQSAISRISYTNFRGEKTDLPHEICNKIYTYLPESLALPYQS